MVNNGRTVLPLWRDVPPTRRQAAASRLHADFVALVAAGFTRDEALKIILAIVTS